MDEELRNALNRMEDKTEEGFTKIDKKVDSLHSKFNNHVATQAGVNADIMARAGAAHHRMDEHLHGHREAQKSSWQLWVVLIGAVAAAAAAVLMGVR